MLLPMLWMLATSFKLPGEIAVWPPHMVPTQPTLSNYSGLFKAHLSCVSSATAIHLACIDSQLCGDDR
jgi:ABC-type glycerol-3-phosphate transport system permease component